MSAQQSGTSITVREALYLVVAAAAIFVVTIALSLLLHFFDKRVIPADQTPGYDIYRCYLQRDGSYGDCELKK